MDHAGARALQNAAVQSLETLSRLLEETRDQTTAIERARQLVALDPAREASCLRLLRLYAGAGDLAVGAAGVRGVRRDR